MSTGTADAFRSPRLARYSLSSFDIAGWVREAAGVKVKRTAGFSAGFAVRDFVSSSPVPALMGFGSAFAGRFHKPGSEPSKSLRAA